jgi:outer membrane protein TolC
MRLTRGYLFPAFLAASALFGQQGQFAGSVPAGALSPLPLALTLHDAIDRGLKANLGLLVAASGSEISRGQRLQALSALMPEAHAQISETEEQLNLKTLGFSITIPGVNINPISGPFHYTDVRAYASWNAFDYSAHKNYRSAQENGRAAQLSVLDARDLVVQATASAYLQIVADASRVQAIRSQV